MITIEMLKDYTPEEITEFDYQFSPDFFNGAYEKEQIRFLGCFYNHFGETIGSFHAETKEDIHELFNKYYAED